MGIEMNEQMLKLYLQSLGVNYIPLPIEDHIPLWTEKFAELIVEECAKIADDNYSLGIPTGQIMKQYFGVEE